MAVEGLFRIVEAWWAEDSCTAAVWQLCCHHQGFVANSCRYLEELTGSFHNPGLTTWLMVGVLHPRLLSVA